MIADPGDWIAQRMVMLSTHPTVVEGGRLAPRHIDLRPFVFLGEGCNPRVLPGGLTRVARSEGALVVNSSQNGGAEGHLGPALSVAHPPAGSRLRTAGSSGGLVRRSTAGCARVPPHKSTFDWHISVAAGPDAAIDRRRFVPHPPPVEQRSVPRRPWTPPACVNFARTRATRFPRVVRKLRSPLSAYTRLRRVGTTQPLPSVD